MYFTDLPPELQRVLGAQLRESGDVSAVIETPRGFLLYLVTEKTVESLKVGFSLFPNAATTNGGVNRQRPEFTRRRSH